MAEILYEYFKKELEEGKVLVRINPESFAGLELIVHTDGQLKETKREFDETIYDELKIDEFEKSSPLEFNLHLKGISG
jgi:hypothetical protein